MSLNLEGPVQAVQINQRKLDILTYNLERKKKKKKKQTDFIIYGRFPIQLISRNRFSNIYFEVNYGCGYD